MSRPSPLAIFTPSLIDPQILQDLFVGEARARFLQDLIARALSTATSTSRAHRMIVGPRGAGKTHLITLAATQISQNVSGVQLAWLPEDPWTIESYADLLQAIERALTPKQIGEQTESAFAVKAAEPQRHTALEVRLRQRVEQSGPIIVLAENFDEVLDAIGNTGQAQLRAFLENDRALLLLVTATLLGKATLSQSAPFYGFFSTVDLAPFTVAEAAEMLGKIARFRGDDALANLLNSESGSIVRHRLQAIDALAGGQPRVWAMLAIALTIEGLSDLATLLLQRFDELVPYYQEQLRRLAPQERKVVRVFAHADRALGVKQLAAAIAVDEKSVSKTVTQLRRSGWIQEIHTAVDPFVDARRTHYELAEPLARLAFQIKDNRGEPLPLLVSFLSSWFSSNELDASAHHTVMDGSIGRMMVASSGSNSRPFEFANALSGQDVASMVPEPLLLRVDDAMHAASLGDAEPYLALPSAIRRMVDDSVNNIGLEQTWLRIASSAPLLSAWVPRTERLARQLGGEDQLSALSLHATALARAGRYNDAITVLQQVLVDQTRILGIENRESLTTRHNIAAFVGESGDTVTALDLLKGLLAECVRILGSDHRDTLTTRHNIAAVTGESGGSTTALRFFNELLLDRVRILGIDHRDTLTTRNNIAYWTGESGDIATALRLFNELLPDRVRTLGADHPDTLRTRSHIAAWTGRSGDTATALRLLNKLLPDQTRILGADHPHTLRTLSIINYLTGDGGA